MKSRKRRHEQPLHAERGPIALRILNQFFGFADPDRPAASLQPIVEQDAGDLPTLASPGAIAQKPAATKPNGVLRIIARRSHDIEGRSNRPGAAKKLQVSFACVNDAFELSIRQDPVRDYVG